MADQDIAPIALTPVEMQVQQAAIDRQRQLALALQQASFQSPEGQMISGHYVAPSWTQQAARLAQGLVGKSQQGYLDDQQRALARTQGDAIRGQFGIGGQQPPVPQDSGHALPQMPLGSGMSDATSPEANANAKLAAMLLPQSSQGGTSAPAAGSRVIPGMNPLQAFQLYNSDPKNYDAAYLKQFDPTDLQKNSRYMGISADENAKATRAEMAVKGLMNLRPEGTVYDAAKGSPIFTAPDSKLGSYTTWANGVPQANEIQGVADIRAKMAAAERRGANQETLAPKDMQPTFDNGTSGTRSINATLHPDNSGFPAGTHVPQPTNVGPMVKGQSDTLSILQQERANAKAADIPAIDREIEREKARQQPSAPQGVGAPFGAETSGKGNAEIVNTHYAGLTAANANAPMELAALQNIKKYAPGAITGAQSDKRAFINGLATLIPGWHPGMDTKTETDLFNKNAARMVAGAGNTGGATDAFNKIKEAANPNNHMSVDAINEAVDQLSALKRMSLDTQAILDPLKQSNNVQGYQSTLTKINKVADPRIWELNAMTPQKQGAFINSLSPQDAKELLQKRATLKQLGVFNGSN